jgi:uncharacterized membrane protein
VRNGALGRFCSQCGEKEVGVEDYSLRPFVEERYCGITAVVIAWSFFHIVWLYRVFLFELILSLV